MTAELERGWLFASTHEVAEIIDVQRELRGELQIPLEAPGSRVSIPFLASREGPGPNSGHPRRNGDLHMPSLGLRLPVGLRLPMGLRIPVAVRVLVDLQPQEGWPLLGLLLLPESSTV